MPYQTDPLIERHQRRIDPIVCYAVVAVNTGKILYCGCRLVEAAVALSPGTMHGQGGTESQVISSAQFAAAHVRAAHEMFLQRQAAKAEHRTDRLDRTDPLDDSR